MATLLLKHPINPFFINQAFGNPAPLYTAQGLKGHNGVDLFAKHGQPVYASHSGTAYSEVDNGGGNGVVIYSDDLYDFEGQQVHFKTIYWHLTDAKAVITYGQHVNTGDLIGYADNTGASTGDHLHFALKPCLKNEIQSSWENVQQQNGYKGAIDPMPYFDTVPPKFIFTKTLKQGMWNNDVKELQKVLGLTPDGVFGPITTLAVRNFQKAHNLTPDGIVGLKTNVALNQL